MAKAQAKQFVVCVDNDGNAASLEKRKIYVALRDAEAEKLGLLRIVDKIRRRLSLSESVLPLDRLAAGRQGEPCWPRPSGRQPGGCFLMIGGGSDGLRVQSLTLSP